MKGKVLFISYIDTCTQTPDFLFTSRCPIMPYLQNWKMCIKVDNVMYEWIMKSNISTKKKNSITEQGLRNTWV